jgi:hypothetical protein
MLKNIRVPILLWRSMFGFRILEELKKSRREHGHTSSTVNMTQGQYGRCFCRFWLTAKLLLALASTVIFGYESHGTHGHILLSDGSGSLQTLPCCFCCSLCYSSRRDFVSYKPFINVNLRDSGVEEQTIAEENRYRPINIHAASGVRKCEPSEVVQGAKLLHILSPLIVLTLDHHKINMYRRLRPPHQFKRDG